MRVKRNEITTIEGRLRVPFTCGHVLTFPPAMSQALLQLGQTAWNSLELVPCQACETEFAAITAALTELAKEYNGGLPC